MKILFVLECTALMTNGTTASCIRFAEELNKRGHEVTCIGCELKGKDKPTEHYAEFENYNFPIFQSLIEKEGFQFVKVDNVKLYELIKETDCVHFFLSFKLASNAYLIARSLNKPVTGAFHLQPDSITSAIHMNCKFLTSIIYKGFRRYLYKKVQYIHCPSKMIEQELKRQNYKSELRVISNGITPFWHKVDAEKEFKDKCVVTMVGRLADEKSQDTLIKAIKYTKHEKDIKLVLCGQGPNQTKYEKLIKKQKLTNEALIRFMNQEDLRKFLSTVDLYCHCSKAEIEGLSCVEAFSCGAVPVISNSKLSATSQFALCDESIYKKGNYKDLAKKIDYWFEHKELLKEYSLKYQELSKEYALDKQVDKFIQFFNDAISNYKPYKLSNKDKRKIKHIYKILIKNNIVKEMPIL
jgi:glycosyltransferase involved in cell wall biosynthesis